MSSNQNRCVNCFMIFQNPQSLQRHQQKFCVGSNYADLTSLQQKFKRSFANTNIIPQRQRHTGLGKYGAMDQQQYAFQIEKQKIKQKNNQQRQYEQLLKQIKEQERVKIQAKLQKQQILKKLRNLDKESTQLLINQKQQNIQLLTKKKKDIEYQEEVLQNQLKQYIQKKKHYLNQQKQEKKNGKEILKNTIKTYEDAKQLQQDFMYDQTKKIAQIQMRRQILQNQKKILEHNIQCSKQKNYQKMLPSRIPVSSLATYNNDKSNKYTFKTEPFDKVSQYRKLVEKNAEGSNAQEKLKYIRANLEPNQSLIAKRRKQLQQIKKQYQQNGGDDPNFYKSIVNLQSKYQNAEKNGKIPFNQNNKKQTSINQSLVQPQTAFNNNTQKMPYSTNLNKSNIQATLPLNSYIPSTIQNPNNPYKQTQKFSTNLATNINPKQQRKIQSNYLVMPNSFTNKDRLVIQQNMSGDQTMEQRILCSVMAQQYDSLQILSRLPKNSELYKIKFKQYQQLTKIRQNMIKQAHQQRLLKIKKQFQMQKKLDEKDKNNEVWVDNVRMNIIKKRNNQINNPKQLNNKTKFNIYCQLISGMPIDIKQSKLFFTLIQNNKPLSQTQQFPQKQCFIKNVECKSNIQEKLEMILELQPNIKALFQISVKDSTNKSKPYGWTSLDLTNQTGGLGLANYQLQLYQPPTNSNKKPIVDSFLYLKIFLQVPSEGQYINPTEISRKTLNQLFKKIQPKNQSIKGSIVGSQHGQPLKPNQGEILSNNNGYVQNNLKNNNNYNNANNYGGLVKKNNQTRGGKNSNLGQYQNNFNNNDLKFISNVPKYNGYKVNVLNANTSSSDQICIELIFYEQQKKLVDQKGKPYQFTTNFKKPKSQRVALGQKQTDILKTAVFNQSFYINQDLSIYYFNSQKQIYLLIKMLSKANNIEENPNNKVKQIGWYCLKLTNFKSLRLGKIKLNLFEDQIKSLPVDMNKVNKKLKQSIQIQFQQFQLGQGFIPKQKVATNIPSPKQNIFQQPIIDQQSSEYSKSQINNNNQKSIKSNNTLIKQNTITSNIKANQNNNLNSRSFNSTKQFISNKEMQKFKSPQSATKNFDLQISYIRTLPSNIGIVKIFIQFIDIKNKRVIQSQQTISQLKGNIYNQKFQYCRMIRDTQVPQNAVAILHFMTYNQSNNIVGLLGFTVIPLFVNINGEPIIQQAQSEHYLMKGCYQFPIFWSNNKKYISIIKAIQTYPKIPCVSLLVKITPNDKQQQTQIPQYSTGIYNNKFFIVSSIEQRLFNVLGKRNNYTVNQSVKKILTSQSLTSKYEQSDIYQFLAKKLQFKNQLISLNKLTNYDYQIGFTLSIQSLSNLKGQNLYIVTICLCPPGNYYKAQSMDLLFASKIDIQSHKKFQKFQNCKFSYNQPFKQMFWVLEVVQVVINKKSKQMVFNTFGYTILPAFQQNVVNSGAFSLPLLSGQFPDTQLQDLISNFKNTKLSIQQSSTIIKNTKLNIKLTNNYFPEQFKNQKFDDPRSIPENQYVKNLLAQDTTKQSLNIILQEQIAKMYEINN